MIKNFIKVTLRNIAGHKVFSAINILGLSIGIACALIIALYLNHEFSYDKFHSDSERIKRVTLHGNLQGTEINGAPTSARLAPFLFEQKNVIECATRITRLGAWLISYDSLRYNEDHLLFADSNFFSIFDGFNIIEGNKRTMLQNPRSIVLTESTALKYFGQSDNIIGKKLKVETKDKLYEVTGLVKDPPSYSHIQFDMLASLSTFDKMLSSAWTSNNVYTYIKLYADINADSAISQINQQFERKIKPQILLSDYDIFSPSDIYNFRLQNLSHIHLHSDLEAELQPNGKAIYVYSLGIIAILVLLIACLNFMNLSTANSSNRSFEVSLRKVVGASKQSLVIQFLVESVIISLIALTLSFLLAELILPVFNNFLGIKLQFSIIANFGAVILILLLTIALGIMAGSYPAFFIAGFDPIEVLNNKFIRGLKSSKIRAVFVVFQFFISILIIILTLVIYTQVDFMMDKELGFEDDNILVIRRSDALGKNIDQFKSDIRQSPDVYAATNSNSIPGRDFYLNTFKLKGEKENSALLFNQIYVNYDFFETFQLKLQKGRLFDTVATNDTFSCILNESALKQLNLSYPIGAELNQVGMVKSKVSSYKIVGIVNDFHFQSLDEQIRPLVICLMPGNWEGYINVRISDNNQLKTIENIEQQWYKYAPDYPFVYFFLNEDFNRNYKALITLGRVFLVFSVLSIFVACLGLFGLISHATNQRIREVGIRKSLGASIPSLVFLLSSEILKLMLLSTTLAWIFAFFIVQFWLSDYYYKVETSAMPYILGLAAVLVAVLPTVLYQSLRVARRSPGLSLKYE